MLGKEIPELMKMIQKEEAAANLKEKEQPSIKGVWKAEYIYHLSLPFWTSSAWPHFLYLKKSTTKQKNFQTFRVQYFQIDKMWFSIN